MCTGPVTASFTIHTFDCSKARNEVILMEPSFTHENLSHCCHDHKSSGLDACILVRKKIKRNKKSDKSTKKDHRLILYDWGSQGDFRDLYLRNCTAAKMDPIVRADHPFDRKEIAIRLAHLFCWGWAETHEGKQSSHSQQGNVVKLQHKKHISRMRWKRRVNKFSSRPEGLLLSPDMQANKKSKRSSGSCSVIGSASWYFVLTLVMSMRLRRWRSAAKQYMMKTQLHLLSAVRMDSYGRIRHCFFCEDRGEIAIGIRSFIN